MNIMKKTGLIFIVMMIVLLLFSTCDEGMFGSLEKLEEQAIEENAPSAGVTKYTVTFDMNEGAGTAPAAQTVEAGTEITLPTGSGFARGGFAFDGWNTAADETGDSYPGGSSFTVNGNVTLYAKWSTSYTVEFNLNNGTGTTPPSQTVSPGANIELPDEDIGFSRSGFTFAGWNTNPNGLGTNHPAGPYTVNASITLYAKWTCTITFSLNNGGGTVPSAQTGIAGTEITLPGNSEFSRTGFSFDGWNTNTSGTGDNYPIGEPYTMNGSRTLYAKWIVDQPGATYHLVRFELNGGVEDSIYGDFNCLAGTTINKPVDPEKDNFTFGAWYSNPELTSAYNFGSPVIGPLTLYAKWRCTVTFETNGGSSVPLDQLVDIGALLTSVTNPGKEHYTFEGWYSDIGLTPANKWNFGSSTAESNMTLYANWTPVQYTVTYNINGGSGTTPTAQTTAYTSSITLKDDTGFNKRGCTFNCWNTNSSGTGTNYSAGVSYYPEENITLWAKWDAITVPPGSTLNAKLDWLEENAISGVDYTLEANSNSREDISPRTLSYDSYTDITITLKSNNTTRRVIGLSSNGTMFKVESGVTLILENYITLNGLKENTSSIVRINANGKLEMKYGSVITGNSASNSWENGGVFVNGSGSQFTMSGGTISGNASSTSGGGGVHIADGGKFIMTGGTIGGATEEDANTSQYGNGVRVTGSGSQFLMSGSAVISGNKGAQSGGGVHIGNGGSFDLSGNAVISGNRATYGAGVRGEGPFTMSMSGGTIGGTTPAEANIASGSGGGVYVSGSGAEFKMSGGNITGNSCTATSGTADIGGGGVFITGGAKFTLSGAGIISLNTTAGTTGFNGGAGVYVNGSGIFEMNGGEISGNIAPNSGGGVFVYNGGTFTMTSGTIGGTNIADANTAGNGGGGVFLSTGSSEFIMNGDAVIEGNTARYGGGVAIAASSSFTMKGSALISGNEASVNSGGGVYVNSGGTFTMENGTISGNKSTSTVDNTGGGGVFVNGVSASNFGKFEMKGGTISRNTAVGSGGGVYVAANNAKFDMSGGTIGGSPAEANTAGSGGGVAVGNGNSGSGIEFTMSGSAKISGNTASSTGSGGGGVYNWRATFTMSDSAEISGNTGRWGGGVYNSGAFDMGGGAISVNTANIGQTTGHGGGVYQIGDGTLTMSGNATISGNTTAGNGGGVYVSYGTITMSGSTATISGNRAANGGGVYVAASTNRASFEMSGGTITGNTATTNGGGVFAGTNINTTFNKTGGTITGYNSGTSNNKVETSTGTIDQTSGSAVYVDSTYKRETTVTTGQSLKWENGAATGSWTD